LGTRSRNRAQALPRGGPEATRRALEQAEAARAVVLVEGISDQIALETLAARRSRSLERDGVAVVPIGGAQAIERFLRHFGPGGRAVTLAGLCDAGEEAVFRSGFARAGFGPELSRARMQERGFFVCVEDLEDELLRAVGAPAVEALLEQERDLAAFRTFQKQPAWRERNVEAQLRRFMTSADRRKLRYARILVEALDPARVPRPLDNVLAHVLDGWPRRT
jgi:Overcoming lysogenization defect protein-like, TOPRIM domain